MTLVYVSMIDALTAICETSQFSPSSKRGHVVYDAGGKGIKLDEVILYFGVAGYSVRRLPQARQHSHVLLYEIT